MADKKDDPREVLTLLNSLGFIGITAQQLKAFMKDLKMHRKIKERERQQWKDETKKKILLRQQELYREVLEEHKMETMNFNNATESTISSESSTFHDDSSYKVVTVKIRCIPKDKENEPEENGDSQKKKTSLRKTHTSWAEEFRQNSLRYDDNGYNTSSSSSIHESHRRFNYSNNQAQNHSAGASTDSTKYVSLEKPKRASRLEENLKQSNLASPKSSVQIKSSSSRHAVGRSENFKHTQSANPTVDLPANPPPSRSSVHSKTKSFIRPWRLQPESHRSSTNTKSDPVALYQKYREEWKQLALPGEENHAGIRWAVREKMLGLDPNPRWDIEMIEKINRDFRSNFYESRSVLDRKEHKIYRRRSRKIRKQFLNGDLIERVSKAIFVTGRKQYTSFKSISESFLVQSTSFKPHNTEETISPQSNAVIPDTCETHVLNGIKIDHNFDAKISCNGVCAVKSNSQSRETRSGVTCAKQTLERLISKLLEKDINSYAETYKYMDKCRCVLRTENREARIKNYTKL